MATNKIRQSKERMSAAGPVRGDKFFVTRAHLRIFRALSLGCIDRLKSSSLPPDIVRAINQRLEAGTIGNLAVGNAVLRQPLDN
jgi:hypothetical protein